MLAFLFLFIFSIAALAVVTPTTTPGTPAGYNYTNVPFDSETAYFFLDYVDGVIDSVTNETAKSSFLNASSILLQTVRKQHASADSYLPLTGFSLITFSYGYPELSPYNKPLQGIVAANRLQPNTSGWYSGFEPRDNEFPFIKRRFDATYNSEMLTLLDAHNIRRVVLVGAVTSRVVLSTMRSLVDRDYVVHIVRDACLDSIDTTFLFETYFPVQAYVLSLEEALRLFPKEPVNPDSVNGFNVS